MKAKGAELTQFYADWPFGDDFFHESDIDEALENDDYFETLPPAETFDLEEQIGAVGWQGDGPEPRYITVNGRRIRVDSMRFVCEVFKAWRGDSITVAVTMPSEGLQALKEFAARMKWKVSK